MVSDFTDCDVKQAEVENFNEQELQPQHRNSILRFGIVPQRILSKQTM
jgi:hypothetical protein